MVVVAPAPVFDVCGRLAVVDDALGAEEDSDAIAWSDACTWGDGGRWRERTDLKKNRIALKPWRVRNCMYCMLHPRRVRAGSVNLRGEPLSVVCVCMPALWARETSLGAAPLPPPPGPRPTIALRPAPRISTP